MPLRMDAILSGISSSINFKLIPMRTRLSIACDSWAANLVSPYWFRLSEFTSLPLLISILC